MDVNDLRSLITVISFLLFICIVMWAWSSRRQPDFEALARLPLEDDEPLLAAASTADQHKGHQS